MVREDEGANGVRMGKQREWDGRGTGVYGWETEEEEDIWEVDLDFGGLVAEDGAVDAGGSIMIEDMVEWRYLKAEKEKEEVRLLFHSMLILLTNGLQGNVAFRQGDYKMAAKHYQVAHEIEPELPHYQLNLAAAQLKLSKYVSSFS